MDDKPSSFLAVTRDWLSSYKVAIASYVAFKVEPDQPPILVSCRILLLPSLNSNEWQPYRFESERVLGGRAILATENIDQEFVLLCCSGKVSINEETYVLSHGESGPDIDFRPFYPYHINDGPRTPYLRIRGNKLWDLTRALNLVDQDELDWELRSAHVPYEGMSELYQDLGIKDLYNAGESSIEVLGAAPALVGRDSIIEEDTATVKVVASPKLERESIRLGVRVFRQSGITRRSVLGNELVWGDEGDLVIGTYEFDSKDALIIEAIVSYQGALLDHYYVADPHKRMNPRLAAHEVIDPDLRVLREFLKADSKRPSDDFEVGVACLLSILGFSVSHLGTSPRLQDAPDIVAAASNGNLLVIECSTRGINHKNKLNKLASRAGIIRERLQASGLAHIEVLPIMVSAITKKELQPEFEAASRYDVGVVCAEDIEELLNDIAPFQPDTNALFERAKGYIPATSSVNSLGF